MSAGRVYTLSHSSNFPQHRCQVPALSKSTSSGQATPEHMGGGNKTRLLNAANLCRSLGATAAVDDVSIHLQRGDVLGLLGLNGAGKSTTLRMLCGMLVPDSGTVSIAGYAMAEQPLKARARIGFLPDQPPLYNDMRVHEYLRLCGQIRGLKGALLARNQAFITEQCALEEVNTKLIGNLSKGFRQRVGLAQAMIHEPDVLLLDEPSNGLDPQQLDTMRTLIRAYAKNHAVVFSTHLLAEAQAICNRVAIIHKGKLVADTTTDGANLEELFRRSIL